MKKIFLCLCLLIPSWGFAKISDIGTDQGNGGDAYSLQFTGFAKNITQYLKEIKDVGFDVSLLAKVVNDVRVESTDQQLTLNGLPKDAINYPSEQRIVFYRGRWDVMSETDRSTLVLHEYLSLLGLEGADYKYSNTVLEGFRAQGVTVSSSSCVIAGSWPQVYFSPAKQQLDKEYFTIETAQYHGVQFYLKAGHGVAILEAQIKGKKTAGTFYSYGHAPAETDKLRLDVYTSTGEQIEAQCEDVDLHLPQ